MTLFWRDDAAHQPDPVSEERLCGLEPPTLDELHQDQLDHEDRIDDFIPRAARHSRMTTAPMLNPLGPLPGPVACASSRRPARAGLNPGRAA